MTRGKARSSVDEVECEVASSCKVRTGRKGRGSVSEDEVEEENSVDAHKGKAK